MSAHLPSYAGHSLDAGGTFAATCSAQRMPRDRACPAIVPTVAETQASQ